MKLNYRAILFSLICLLFVLPSCTKKVKSGSSTLTQNSSLSRIPDSTIAFLTWETSSEAYKSFRQSQWGQAGSAQLLDTARQMAREGKQPELEQLAEVLVKTGLLTTSANQAEVIKDGVAFISSESLQHTPAVGVYLSASEGTNFRDKLSAMRELLKSNSYEVLPLSGSRDGFVVKIKSDSGQSIAIYLAATPELMAISSQESFLNAGFEKPSSEALKNLQSSPSYIRTTSKIDGSNQISLAYVDLAKLIAQVKATVPLSDTANAKKIMSGIDSFPGEALTWSRSFGPALLDSVALSLNPQTEDQKRWTSVLHGGGSAYALQKLPSNILIGFTIDGSLLRNIRDLALGDLDSESKELLSKTMSMLDGLDGISVGARGGSGASPFPELAIVGAGSNVDGLATSFQFAIDQILSNLQFNLGPWQSKQTEKAQFKYLMSPLGIGAYVVRGVGSAILSTSEAIANDTLNAQQGKGTNLGDNLTDGAKSLLKRTKPLLFGFMNFDKLASTIENLQGSLAFFTGGKAAVESEKIQAIRSLGAMAFSVSSEGNIILGEAAYDKPSK